MTRKSGAPWGPRSPGHRVTNTPRRNSKIGRAFGAETVLSTVSTISNCLAAEVPVGVVFGGNGNTVFRGRPIVPVVEHGSNDLFINSVTEALEQFCSNHISVLVNCDLHNHVT